MNLFRSATQMIENYKRTVGLQVVSCDVHPMT